ncbi:trigger factor [Propionimicrobium lymphophilum ACS-093-V-SCH5]|uniref:Trigger factor n=1 Tax=Propionimicrobium lymphophilum ACS-093-V-SCH5 TaxID=883161 RepID=S2W0S1_9ACTN|nr:trigger factor [Propionimicrobium lymphophilum]EPD31970.1 trigger factor [Propionimicrobium lymphophilum ACS-093-V-SCH5]
MPSTFEQINPTRAKLTVEIPFADLEPSIKQAYKNIANQVNIPGFRKGKVPARLIDQRFGRGVVLEEAINKYLPESYAEAVRENDVHPLGQPEIDIKELDDGNKVVYTAELDVRPDFDLPDFSKIKVEVPAIKVDDDLVNERVDMLRTQFAKLEEVDRKLAKGDVAVFDLTATKDGKALPEGEAKDVQYRLGDGGMLDGLDEALEGMKAGDEKTFESTLVGGELRGVEADITVTINKVMNQELPELNDDFAQMVSQFDTVDEMLDDLREGLTRVARLQQANDAREEVLQKLVEAAKFDLPEKLLADEKEARKANIEQQLSNAGLTLDQYLKNNDEEPETADEFWEEIGKRSEEGLRAQIILDKFAEGEEISVSQEELTSLIVQKAQQAGSTPEQEMSHMLEHNHMGEWMNEVRRGKALGTIVTAAQISDDAGEKLDLAKLNNDGTIAEDSEDSEEKSEKKEDKK